MIAVMLLVLMTQIPDSVKNEPVAEKRYQLALAEAAKLFEPSNQKDLKQKLEAIADLTEFALASLEAMDRPAYRNAGNYKRAEIRTRDFLRRADTLIKLADVDDRPALEPAFNRINAVHEKLLEGVMSKKP